LAIAWPDSTKVHFLQGRRRCFGRWKLALLGFISAPGLKFSGSFEELAFTAGLIGRTRSSIRQLVEGGARDFLGAQPLSGAALSCWYVSGQPDLYKPAGGFGAAGLVRRRAAHPSRRSRAAELKARDH
jgi:hypothetical protein